METSVDLKLSKIMGKIDLLELDGHQAEYLQKTDIVQNQMINLRSKTIQLDKACRLLENDLRKQDDEVDNLQRLVENMDSNLRKNNLRVKGLKEGVEEGSLKGF